jgi:hypothetical protein
MGFVLLLIKTRRKECNGNENLDIAIRDFVGMNV